MELFVLRLVLLALIQIKLPSYVLVATQIVQHVLVLLIVLHVFLHNSYKAHHAYKLVIQVVMDKHQPLQIKVETVYLALIIAQHAQIQLNVLLVVY
jgi:hypothetical protein